MTWLALAAALLLEPAAPVNDAATTTATKAPEAAGASHTAADSSRWVPVARVRPLPPHDPGRGRALYDRHCRACHGRSGRGNGPVASSLTIQPRDLTLGVFKVRSTPSGSPPTDEDLFETVTFGLGGAMPGWGDLPEHDRWQLVQTVKTFSPRFQRERPQSVLAALPARGGAAGRGRAVYEELRCAECHGPDGRGGGAAAAALTDGLRRAVAMPNLRRAEIYRAGCSPEALQKTLLSGLDGTPMPAFDSALGPEEARDLVAFIRSLLARPERCWR